MISRAFNRLEIDERKGTVTKSSAHSSKLEDEIAWYAGLPQELQHLSPRTIKRGTAGPNNFIELEYYSYPPLSEVYTFGRWDFSSWQLALGSIEDALKTMAAVTSDALPRGVRRAAMLGMYCEKTTDRLELTRDDPRFGPFWDEVMIINGRSVPGLSSVIRSLPMICSELVADGNLPFCLIHGDLCLNNILFDRRNRFVKLIDPRGRFGCLPLLGDPRYELAKLSHSIIGGYDLIIGGLFSVHTTASSEIKYAISSSQYHKTIGRMFEQWLRNYAGYQFQNVKIIEALLFLSMIPLQSDSHERQLCFLARGLDLLADHVSHFDNTDSGGSKRLSNPVGA